MLDCVAIISLFLIKPAETIKPIHTNHTNKPTQILIKPVTVNFLIFYFRFNIDDILSIRLE